MAGLDPSTVDDVVLVGDGGAVVGGEEEEEASDVFGEDGSLEALSGDDAELFFGAGPVAALAGGGDVSGEDAVDADVLGAEFVGEGSGETDEGGLGGDVDVEVFGGDHPGDGAHVDDGAPAGGVHEGCDGLGGEELVAEVDGHALVPVGGGDVGEAVAVVVGSVVDEDAGWSEGLVDLGDGGLEGGDVGEVAAEEEGLGVVGGVGGWRRFEGEVEDGDASALEGEVVGGGSTDS